MLPNLTLVIQGIAFFAVVWLVMKFGWPHIMAAIEERQQKIAEGLAAADNSQKALAQAQDQVNEELKVARAKANEIIEQAHQRANQIVDAAKTEAIAEGTRQKALRSEEHTSELQSLMRISYAVFCLQTKHNTQHAEPKPHIHH